MPCQHAHLQTVSGDPTNTQRIRERFVRAIRQRFRSLRGAIREVIGYDEDRLNLKQNARLVERGDIERFPTDSGKARKFIEWLRERLRSGVLEAKSREEIRNGEHWSATYIRSSFVRGWENARARLRTAGASVETVEDIFNLGVPQRQLKKLYTRTYENLESVTEDTAPVVREVLTDGLAEGINPREMASRLNSEIESIQKKRAETLARTETLHSYSEATVSRYERAGVETVQHGEWMDSDDDRVCPICSELDGREIPMSNIREATFTFEPDDDQPDSLGGEYPVMPPAHPSGRCALLPVIS
jgi:SPP1 gp7 family putative phage head morphogenesis protein